MPSARAPSCPRVRKRRAKARTVARRASAAVGAAVRDAFARGLAVVGVADVALAAGAGALAVEHGRLLILIRRLGACNHAGRRADVRCPRRRVVAAACRRIHGRLDEIFHELTLP